MAPRRTRLPVPIAATLATTTAAGVLFSACAGPTGTPAAGSGSVTTAAALPTATSGPTPACAVTAMTAHRSLPYAASPAGTDPDLMAVDVYEPVAAAPNAGCPARPVLVYVHGGGWRRGDKAAQMHDKIDLAQREGLVLVSVNYRLTPEVRFPTHNEDAAAAIAWVHGHIGEYGGDPQRMTLMGHSAGAAIVAAIATDEGYLASHELGLDTIECAVPLDTEGYDVAQQVAKRNDVYVGAFGTDPTVLADASPINHLEPGKALPTFLVVVQDKDRRAALSEAFAAEVVASGGSATVLRTPDLDHEGVNDAVGKPGDPVVTPALVDFLRTCNA